MKRVLAVGVARSLGLDEGDDGLHSCRVGDLYGVHVDHVVLSLLGRHGGVGPLQRFGRELAGGQEMRHRERGGDGAGRVDEVGGYVGVEAWWDAGGDWRPAAGRSLCPGTSRVADGCDGCAARRRSGRWCWLDRGGEDESRNFEGLLERELESLRLAVLVLVEVLDAHVHRLVGFGVEDGACLVNHDAASVGAEMSEEVIHECAQRIVAAVPCPWEDGGRLVVSDVGEDLFHRCAVDRLVLGEELVVDL